jgi:hypothetical protein
MAVLVTSDKVKAAIKNGKLMLLKRVNAPGNAGKSPELVLAEELNKILNPLPPSPQLRASLPPLDGAAE